MKKLGLVSIAIASLLLQAQASEATKAEDRVSKVDTRPSIIVNKSDFKKYFSGGEVRIDMLYPGSDTEDIMVEPM